MKKLEAQIDEQGRSPEDLSKWLTLMRAQVAAAKEEERGLLEKQRRIREEATSQQGQVTGSVQVQIRRRERIQRQIDEVRSRVDGVRNLVRTHGSHSAQLPTASIVPSPH